MYGNSALYAQDTIRIDDNSSETITNYGARDSIYADLKKKQVHLYGAAHVETEGISMTAGYILLDLDKEEITATYAYDKDSNHIELPVFKDGQDEIIASTLKYNLKTERAYIQEVRIQQDELYLYMEEAKRHPNEEIHFKKGRLTTCDLDYPHYHFQLSKAVMVPEKRIVTGPMNLWIAGVPTPLGLPFSVIPQQKERKHGIIFPEIIPLSAYGFGVNQFGYYFPINNNIHTTAFANLYSRGSWGLGNKTEYLKRYKHKGNVELGFQQFRTGFPNNINQNKINLRWTHIKDPKSSPYWGFSSNVNFTSDNNTKSNLEINNQDYFKNTLASDINLNRNFPSKPFRMGLKMSLRQNSTSKNIQFTAPVFNFNTDQFFPLKNIIDGNKPWQQLVSRIGVSYRFEGQNAATFKDSLLRQSDFAGIGASFKNGMTQGVIIQNTGGLFNNTLKITPSIAYNSTLNFQQTRKDLDTATNSTITNTIQSTGYAQTFSFQLNATTKLFSYYKFVGKKQPLLRHILTPSIGVNYMPNLNPLRTENFGPDSTSISYSPFETSLYSSGVSRDQMLINFGFNNTFELKQKSEKDTVTGFSKTRIIDAFSIRGNYDLIKDSMNLSPITLDLRINPVPWLSIVASSTFSPYGWVDSTGATIKDYALSSNGKLGRITTNTINTSLTLTSKESREKINDTKNEIQQAWDSDLNYFAMHPEQVLNFDIPWKVTFTHIYSLTRNTFKTSADQRNYEQVQSVLTSGDISFTKRWKLSGSFNLDLKEVNVTNARFVLSRDMHCWALSFLWNPIGLNKSFLLSIRNTSSLFGDAKLDFRKPPIFF